MKSSNGTVFVVDDDSSIRTSTARLLKSAGLTVETFSSAQEFLQHHTPSTPSCLVLDVRMPGLSGLDLQSELAQADLEVPIIFITGHGSVPMSVKAMKAGAVDFLQKPFDDEQLLDAVRHAIERDVRRRRERSTRDEIERRAGLLTARERQVFALVVSGMLNKQVGGELGMSEKTVKVHRARVMKKMGAGSLAELVRLAVEIGVVGDGEQLA